MAGADAWCEGLNDLFETCGPELRVKAVGSAGSTAGWLYALSTVGSILGTFLPVFWLMPTYGTRATIFIFAGLLMAISALGLIAQARRAGE